MFVSDCWCVYSTLNFYGVKTKCGEGGIRTHGPVAEAPVFKTGAFVHSATSPGKFGVFSNEQELNTAHAQN